MKKVGAVIFALIILVLAAALIYALMIPLYALTGLIIRDFWAWFIVPVFGLPALTITQALGVSLTIGFMTKRPPLDQKNEDQAIFEEKPWLKNDSKALKKEKAKNAGIRFVSLLSYLLMNWLVGWVIHTYWM